ncbi:MAG: glycosyltransferase [Alphaproteobacteria bacterium]|nr:glycosyltransferase [Alphaproteobacteria bacterium]
MTPRPGLARRVAGAGRRRLGRLWRDAGFGPGLSARRARALIGASGVFDAAWYRARYDDKDRIGGDPLGHYLRRGAARGFDPSPLFWTAWYAERFPESLRFGGGPLTHYLLGCGSDPNPVFDDAFYRTQVDLPPRMSPLAHYVGVGAGEGRDPHPLFDTDWYAARQNGAEGRNPLAHFLDRPNPDDPHPAFNAAVYLARYPDVAAAGVNPLVHFVLGGVRDLRDPSPEFCTARYLRRSAEARASTLNPLVHALRAGIPVETAPAPPPLAAAPPLTVSAIVPNYNHARFLRERLDTILGQTVPPDEIVFLDDASTDDSLAIAEAYAVSSPIPFRIVPSPANSGSPFGQWARGIALATGDLVWMAESDDACDAALLARLKPAFADPAVMLAYAQSQPVAADGLVLARDYRDYTDDLSLDRWQAPCVAEGRAEVMAALAHRNTIPNGSAVLMRRAALGPELEALSAFRQCGDWRLYLACAAAGRIAYAPEVLNRHRRHGGALTLALADSLAPMAETLRLRVETMERFDLPDETFLASLAAAATEYYQRTGGEAGGAPPLWDASPLKPWVERLRAEALKRFGPGPHSLHIVESADTASPPAAPQAGPTRTFLAAVRPAPVEPDWPKLPWLEGGARAWIWSAPALWAGNDAAADPRRIAVLATIAELVGVRVVSGDGADAARLAAAIAGRL